MAEWAGTTHNKGNLLNIIDYRTLGAKRADTLPNYAALDTQPADRWNWIDWFYLAANIAATAAWVAVLVWAIKGNLA